MTIKELAFSAQQQLQASIGRSLKRAHIYELLAASFGFNSYAAFRFGAIPTQQRPGDQRIVSHTDCVSRRWIDLGYPPETADVASASLGSFLAERQIGVVRIADFIDQLRGASSSLDEDAIGDDFEQSGDDHDDRLMPPWADGGEGDVPPIMMEGLEAAAKKDNPLAHYALALIYASDEDDADNTSGSSYWHSQALQGRVLTGVTKEWADAHAASLERAEKHARHLREAGRLGNPDALLDLAEQFGDPSFFEQRRRDAGADPSTVAEIAERLGRAGDVKYWLTVAAESGDTDAMLRLIEEHDRGDLARCWTWVYLSRLVGTDLTEDMYSAIHEDGSDYDDDIGGPAYVAGRDGVDLDPLSAGQDAAARDAAQALFEKIRQAAAGTAGQ